MARRSKVLVVVGEPDLRCLFMALCEAAGCEASAALDKEEALRLARSERPGLVLFDLPFPEDQSVGLAREISRDPALSGIPMILMSDAPEELTSKDAGLAGWAVCVRKPFSAKDVVRQIRDGVRRCEPGV